MIKKKSTLDELNGFVSDLANKANKLFREQQSALSCAAYSKMELCLIEQIIDGERDFLGTDLEYWGPLHDKLIAKLDGIK